MKLFSDESVEDRFDMKRFADKHIGANGQPSHKRLVLNLALENLSRDWNWKWSNSNIFGAVLKIGEEIDILIIHNAQLENMKITFAIF